MTGPSRLATYRLRARPGADKKYRIVIQRRRWGIFWRDWYPVENAVRTLQHEFIEHLDRMQEIMAELKDAQSWVDGMYSSLDLGNKGDGTTAPFKDILRPQESLMPDIQKRYEEAAKLVQEGQAGKRHERGTRTMFIGQTGSRFDVKSLNREQIGEEFNADHVIMHRPQQQDHNRHSKGRNQNQQQQDKKD